MMGGMRPAAPGRGSPSSTSNDGDGDRLLSVFSPGRLLDEGFMADLLERPVSSLPCRLGGFRVVELGGGARWPVLVPDERGVVEGKLYWGLDRRDLERLDAYEGVGEGLYRRQSVVVEVGERGQRSREVAFVYLPTERTLRRYGAG